MFDKGESIEFAGKCISSLAQDPNLMKYSSKVLIAADYAQSRNIRDIDGRAINSFRQINEILPHMLPSSLGFVNYFIPNFVKIPKFAITLNSSKFY